MIFYYYPGFAFFDFSFVRIECHGNEGNPFEPSYRSDGLLIDAPGSGFSLLLFRSSVFFLLLFIIRRCRLLFLLIIFGGNSCFLRFRLRGYGLFLFGLHDIIRRLAGFFLNLSGGLFFHFFLLSRLLQFLVLLIRKNLKLEVPVTAVLHADGHNIVLSVRAELKIDYAV